MTPLLDEAVGWRHGIVADVAEIPVSMADLPLANFGAALRPVAGGPSSGGVAADPALARCAAIGESLERYAAALCPLPVVDPSTMPVVLPLDRFSLWSKAQRADAAFPYSIGDGPFTAVFSVLDGSAAAAPMSLVTLDPAHTTIATSSGLAADGSPVRALLRAVQELVERDALMTTWLHSIGGRRVALPLEFSEPVLARGGDAVCLDLTPAYSPHPVAAVAGCLPLQGRPRLSLGVACRSRWEDAVAKAWSEWAQGVVFAGLFAGANPGLTLRPDDVTDFDRHAAYYTLHPDRWPALPLLDGPAADAAPDSPVVGPPAEELRHLCEAIGAPVYYRDLTTVDTAAVGVRVVRALAPDLLPIHADHRWPHLGGRAAELAWRYPWARPGPFPNPAPHPLG